MPKYDYTCPCCGTKEARIAGIDDRLAACSQCNCSMERHQSKNRADYDAYWSKANLPEADGRPACLL